MSNVVSIRGVDVSLTELRADVAAAVQKGLTGKFAFTPETVQALLERIDELSATQFFDKPAAQSDYVSFAVVCRTRLGIDPAFAVRYANPGFSTEASVAAGHRTPYCAEGLMIKGGLNDYHSLSIHRDSVERFVERVLLAKRA